MGLTRRDFLKLSGGMITLTFLFPKNLYAIAVEIPHLQIPVLMYHDISNDFKDEYTISPPMFAAQMEWLYSNGYRALSFREVEGLKERLREKAVIITFDDGYATFIEYAFPRLKEYGFRATINIIGEYVGTFIRHGGNRPMLSWDEYRHIIKSGLIDLGCHTYKLHQWKGSVFSVSEKELEDDLLLFQKISREETGKSAEILAWPYGLYNDNAITIAKRRGFKYILTSNEGYLRRDSSLYEIPRLNMNNKRGLISFQKYRQ